MSRFQDYYKLGVGKPVGAVLPLGGIGMDTTNGNMYIGCNGHNNVVAQSHGKRIDVKLEGCLLGTDWFRLNSKIPKTIAISHKDTSNQSSVNNSGNTVIQDISLDSYGHVTGISSITINHANTSNLNGWLQSSGKSIEKIKVDSNGHIIAVAYK